MNWPLAMLIALMIDAAIGWPDALFRRAGHPVTWLGTMISALECRLNQGGRQKRFGLGLVMSLLVISTACLAALMVTLLLPSGWSGLLICGIFAWPLVAARSMHDHVAAIIIPLGRGDLPGARSAVAMIVGRQTNGLDEAGVIRAALESLAENTSDGIVAPLFWGAIFGLPGIAAYKAINTLDSMIGHHTGRYEYFGKAAARIDDIANLVPARLTGLLFALVSLRPGAALRVMLRDARHHRSPNAGWPEAALAGAIGVRLSGPRIYGAETVDEPFVNGNAPDPALADLRQGLRLYRRILLALAALLGLWACL